MHNKIINYSIPPTLLFGWVTYGKNKITIKSVKQHPLESVVLCPTTKHTVLTKFQELPLAFFYFPLAMLPQSLLASLWFQEPRIPWSAQLKLPTHSFMNLNRAMGFIFYYIYLFMCIYTCTQAFNSTRTCRSESSFQETVLSFHYVCYWDQIQLRQQVPVPAKPSHWLQCVNFKYYLYTDNSQILFPVWHSTQVQMNEFSCLQSIYSTIKHIFQS